MAIAAVPNYIPRERFAEASPALRFGMYLKVWSEGSHSASKWAIADKGAALNQAGRLGPGDKQAMDALLKRQSQIADSSLEEMLRITAKSNAPFTTGLGQPHPLENGFSFMQPQGIPYLPGSGVKGVLRRAATELRDTGDENWCMPARFGGSLDLGVIDLLFGMEYAAEHGDSFRGVLSFWDVIPRIHADTLLVEVMTPHQSHYVQGKESPHDSGKPNPIVFLTVPPESEFMFHVACDRARASALAPQLLADGLWRRLLESAFEHAFDWLGFGAKTAVGYGALRRDREADRRDQEARLARERSRQLASMSEGMRRITEFEGGMRNRCDELKGGKDAPNTTWHVKARELASAASGWSPEEQRQAAEAIEAWLPKVVRVEIKEERKKLKLRQLKGEP